MFIGIRFQVLYKVRSCTEDYGIHRFALSPAGILSAICTIVSQISLLFWECIQVYTKWNYQMIYFLLVHSSCYFFADLYGILYMRMSQITDTISLVAPILVTYRIFLFCILMFCLVIQHRINNEVAILLLFLLDHSVLFLIRAAAISVFKVLTDALHLKDSQYGGKNNWNFILTEHTLFS